ASGTAMAQQNQAAPPGQAKAADAAKKVDDKGKAAAQSGKADANKADAKGQAAKSDQAPGKADQAPGQADKQSATNDTQPTDEAKLKDRATRQRAQRDAEKAKVIAALKGQPMNDAMKQELRRHAQRIARLERIKQLASDAKDDAATTQVAKLVDKENARHD